MADAAILIGGYLRRITNFSLLGYNHKSGFLIRFTLNGISYLHVNQVDFRKDDQIDNSVTAGYYDEAKFLAYKANKLSLVELSVNKKDPGDLEKGVINDNVNVRKLFVAFPYTNLQIDDISWNYTGGDVIDAKSEIIIPTNPKPNEDINPIIVDPVASGFYTHNIPLINNINIPQADRDAAAYVIAKVALQINNIQKFIFPIFKSDASLNEYITSQNFEWTSRAIFTNPSIKEIQSYLNNLTAFYNVVYNNQIIISATTLKTKLYWLVYLLAENTLGIIPAFDKINVLNITVKNPPPTTPPRGEPVIGDLEDHTFSIDEPKFIIKIVKSIISGQEDDFLEGLKSFDILNKARKTTLFEALYKKLSISGDENLKEFINEMYKIWIRSSLYPYNFDGTVKENLINPSNYVSKPIELNYETDRVLWAFNRSNYDFAFNNLRIDVTETIDLTIEHQTISNDVAIGSYDIFQTITIKNTDSNTNTITFISINVDNIKRAVLPIFYLKYIDDKKSTDNLVVQLELTFDLILLISSAGSFEGLALLKNINRLGRVVLGLEAVAPADIIITYNLVIEGGKLIDITGNLAKIFLDYFSNYKDTYCNVNSSKYDKEKCDFYSKLDSFFTVLQVLTAVIDFVTSRLLKNASKRLILDAPEDLNPEVKSLLQKFAGDLADATEAFRLRVVKLYGDDSVIWRKFNSLEELKQEQFLEDFGTAEKETLDALHANDGDLIDYWDDIEYLKGERKGIEFLQSFKSIMDDANLLTHVHVGHPRIKTRVRHGIAVTSTGEITGSHNSNILRKPPPPPLLDGEMSWLDLDLVKNSNKSDPSLGYQQGEVIRNMHDQIDPRTNTFFVKGDGTVISSKVDNVYFPTSYDTKKINEEMAFVNSKINKLTPEIKVNKVGQHSFIFETPATDGHILYVVYLSPTSDFKSAILQTIYPKKF